MSETESACAREWQQKIDKPNTEDDHNHNAGNLCEWRRERDLRENPPDQPEDDAHYENGDEQSKHGVYLVSSISARDAGMDVHICSAHMRVSARRLATV
jgi:hypothetical protein